VQIAELLTRQVFRLEERRKQEHQRQVVAQIHTIQRYVFRNIHFRFLAQHGQIEGSRLAQATVDKLFARANSLKGSESVLAAQFAAEIARDNCHIRNAAFICLLSMLEVEIAHHNAPARRRIVNTLHWLRHFGEIPPGAREPDALELISQALEGHSRQAREH